MKNFLTLISIALVSLFLAACSQDSAPPAAEPTAAPAPTQQAAPAPAKAGGTTGTVVETMDAAGYTYVQVDNGTEKIWAAAPKFAVAVGDSVIIPEGMAMENYHSKTLDRDFPVVYFVDSVMNASTGSAPAAAPLPAIGEMNGSSMPQGHPSTSVSTAATDIDLSNIQKAEGGLTVGEIFSGKADLSGKEVTLRAKVVKFSPQIMGKNWLHLQDGSGEEGANDLTVTTDVSANVGDTVLVNGMVSLDKDFGYGYKYNVIIEDAKVTVE